MVKISLDDIARLEASGQFDAAWYSARYPDATIGGMSAEEHYLWIGRKLGRRGKPASSKGAGLPIANFHLAKGGATSSVQPHTFAFDALSYKLSNSSLPASMSEADLERHWRDHGLAEGRIGSGLSRFAGRSMWQGKLSGSRPRVAFFAPVSAQSGLGTAAQGYAAALSSLPIVLEVIDSTAALYPQGGGSIAALQVRPDIVIIHQNADALCNLLRFTGSKILDDCYVIGIWVWETMSLPSQWRDNFAAVDEVWVPSTFCAEAVRAVGPAGLPVEVVPHVVTVKSVDSGAYNDARKVLGIPADAFTFLCAFDASSSLERKNPQAALAAFADAFRGDPSALLIVKYHSAGGSRSDVRELRRSYAASNVLFVDLLMTDKDTQSLMQAADCLVSPHRAEGFGLNIAEMMAMGKPVIATNYSGSLEFCQDDNCILIPCQKIEVTAESGSYPTGAVWAEPDHASLVESMRRLAHRPALASSVGMAAQATIEAKLAPGVIAARIEGLLNNIVARRDEIAAELARGWEQRKSMVWRHPLALAQAGGRSFAEMDWPLISIVVPVYNISPELLAECVDSVFAQSYPHWELCLCDDASTNQATINFLEGLRARDQRIRVRRLSRNVGISVASNAAVEMASGAYIAFLDNDDTIEPDALELYAKAIRANPGCDMLYCDEDKIDFEGRYVDHYFKPDWSPDHLESCMYVLHMLTVRKALFLQLGGYREAFTGAQDYDLALRISLTGGQVVHVPRVLYHWRMIPGSASADVNAKPQALLNAQAALGDYADRRYGADAKADTGMLPGLFRIRRGQIIRPPVTLVMTTNSTTRDVAHRGEINLPENFLRSILEKTEYNNYRVLISSNGVLTDECRKMLSGCGGREIVYCGPQGRFNFADKANFSMLSAETDLVVLLNDDMEIRNGEWLGALVDQIVKEDVGAVGAHLTYPDDRIQHCGMVVGVNETSAHVYHGYPGETVGYNGYPAIIRNYSAVTGACMATRRTIYEQVGGFDTAFATDFNDTDFCLRLRRLGYRVVYTPFARLYHFESQTAVRSQQAPAERDLFVSRWQDVITNDPYHNPNLRKDSITFDPQPQLWPVPAL